MKDKSFSIWQQEAFSPALITGLAVFLVSGLLFFPFPDLFVLLLGFFVLLCLAAPFFPQAGFFLPVISRGRSTAKVVALTFDDGPDTEVTPKLLDLLDRHGVTATFFVVGKKAEDHSEIIREILKRGHTLGNHSYHHDPFLMLRSRDNLQAEIARTQTLLHTFGIHPLAFRPPVGITNPRLSGVLMELDMYCVTFSCRAFDRGNRHIKGLASTILKKIRPGAIVLLHDVTSTGKGGIPDWFKEMELIFSGLKARGYEIIPLADLIGRPVMERLPATTHMP